jgi:protein-S-isoprenylcysteine O-methyltransferase Ste14
MRSRSFRSWLVLLYALLAYLFGIRALVYFVGFASNAPHFRSVDSGAMRSWPEALLADLALLLVFALSHSLMARDSFKQIYLRRFPAATLRSSYGLVAATTLSGLMWQWQPIDTVVWAVRSEPGHWLLIGTGAAGWLLAAVAYYSIGHLELLGLRPAWRYFKDQPPAPPDLVTSGIYRRLRDPMYIGFAIGLWSTPKMTAGHLLLAAATTVYVLIGMRYERKDLVGRFGQRYLTWIETVR